MSLAIVSCSCGGAENLARRVLQKGGCKYWLEVPIFKGKEKLKDFFAFIPPTIPEKDREILKIGVKDKSSYVLIVGYDENHMIWADLKSGGIKSQLDGEVITSEFA